MSLVAGAAAKRSLYFEYPRYPFRRPPELDGAAPRHPVAIVGGGPVGLALALELARHGVASVVIEDDDTVADGSRAVCIARRSMEILQGLGLAERFLEKALEWTSGTSYYRNRPVYRLEMPHCDDERFFPMTNLQQCYMERFLVERIADEARIEIRWRSRVAAVEQDGEGARLRVQTAEGDYDLAADWVVACDGARSTMRQLMGLRLTGTSYEGTYLIADIRMASDHPTERRAWFDPPANPGSTVLMHKQPDDIWRVDYQLLDDADLERETQEQRIRERIQMQLDMAGETAPWELDWYSLYRAHCLCLDDYRQGRVLFAGDAAHLVPIFGVRGLNSGFADANNLGWKLAYVLRGLAPERLLDSYSPERRAATQEIFREAGKSTKFMTPPSRGYRLMRDAALSLALSQGFARGLIDPRQSRPYDYVASPLNGFTGDEAAFTAGPRVGAPLRNVRLAGRNRDAFLLDHLQPGFTGLYFSADGTAPDGIASLAASQLPFRPLVVSPSGGDIADPERRVFAAYGAEEGSFYLARPDAHVCARWRQLDPAALQPALAEALGCG